MRCEQLLYKFTDFDPNTHYVVAPEGMNRLYIDGFGGEVVATWMTKRDRLHEINDFSNYLSALYQQETEKLPKTCKRFLFGFSQGGTTLYRWLHARVVKADALIGYSCWIPEDINLKESQTELSSLNSIYTYGNEDQFLTENRIDALMEVIAKNGLEITPQVFEGKHRIERKCLRKLFEERLR